MYRGHISARLLFDFDTSINYNMFCSCGQLGPFLFARHVVSSYNARYGMARFKIKRLDGLLLALSNFNAGPGCFVNIIAQRVT